jgi:hypothetical protein
MNEDAKSLTQWHTTVAEIVNRVAVSDDPKQESLVALSQVESLSLDSDGKNLLSGLLLRTAERNEEAKVALEAAAKGKNFYFGHMAKSVLSKYARH